MKRILTILCCLLLMAIPSTGLAGKKTGALGRFSPKHGIVNLLGLSGQVISAILVKQGDVVKKGQSLAVFANRDQLALKLQLAELAEKEAREHLKHAVDLQSHKVALAEADLAYAQKRRDNFGQNIGDSLSRQQMEMRRYECRAAEQKLAGERDQLAISKLVGAARVARTAKQAELARTQLDTSVLKAPQDGTILRVLKMEGETCGGVPLIRMADLKQMYVIAEIYEGDLLDVKVGMATTVSSGVLPKKLTGRVESIGRVVARNTKVAKVWIRLDEPETASRLLNMEVDVSIDKKGRKPAKE